MKRLLFISLFALFISCDNEDDCDCGIIENDNVNILDDFTIVYSLDVRNNCSDEIEYDIEVTEDLWISSFVGEELCDIETIRLN